MDERKKSYSKERKRLLKKKTKCHYCKKGLNKGSATVDHKQPLSKGGYNKPKNYVLSCAACNQKKGSMPYEDFLKLMAEE